MGRRRVEAARRALQAPRGVPCSVIASFPVRRLGRDDPLVAAVAVTGSGGKEGGGKGAINLGDKCESKAEGSSTG